MGWYDTNKVIIERLSERIDNINQRRFIRVTVVSFYIEEIINVKEFEGWDSIDEAFEFSKKRIMSLSM